MSTAKPDFLDIDNDKFKSIIKISNKDSIEQKKDRSGSDDDSSKTLQLLRIKGFPRLLPEGLTHFHFTRNNPMLAKFHLENIQLNVNVNNNVNDYKKYG